MRSKLSVRKRTVTQTVSLRWWATLKLKRPQTNSLRYRGILEIVSDKFRDECGVFGIYGHADAARLTYLGLYALQHRRQASCRITSSNGSELRLERAMGHVADSF